MSVEFLFSVASTLALVGWVTLALVPRWPMARALAGVVLPLVLAAVYLTLVVRYMPGAQGGFGSLAQVALLFQQPELLLAGWIHYLAFDLFIGGWETRDAVRHDIPRLLVISCLALTFMLGPIGLLSYFLVRSQRLRALSVEPT